MVTINYAIGNSMKE